MSLKDCENNETQYQKQIFICTKCVNDHHLENVNYAEEMRMELKEKLSQCMRDEGKNPRSVRVNKAGCLGVCNDGIHAVVYPQGKWFKKLSKNEIPDLIDYLKSDS